MGYLMYALVVDGEMTLRQPGRLERKLSDNALLGAPDGLWTEELAALCGFVRVAETDRPDDTDTTTHDRSVALVDGVPTVVWTERQKTGEELKPPEPTPEEKLAAVTARLDAIAPVRSEHDVPADPTYLPPATDLRTPR